jgi:hypothetical protein
MNMCKKGDSDNRRRDAVTGCAKTSLKSSQALEWQPDRILNIGKDGNTISKREKDFYLNSSDKRVQKLWCFSSVMSLDLHHHLDSSSC